MLPPLEFFPDPHARVPKEAECAAIWDKYAMPPHIREHCRSTAEVALDLARKAMARGYDMPVDLLRAAALLHDIAKIYTVHHGGSHTQLGAAWTREETGNPALAQAVRFHVRWPWDEGPLSPEANPLCAPLLVSYADKRTRHHQVVTLQERFDDLLNRYGDTDERRESIRKNLVQARRHEQALAALLGPL